MWCVRLSRNEKFDVDYSSVGCWDSERAYSERWSIAVGGALDKVQRAREGWVAQYGENTTAL